MGAWQTGRRRSGGSHLCAGEQLGQIAQGAQNEMQSATFLFSGNYLFISKMIFDERNVRPFVGVSKADSWEQKGGRTCPSGPAGEANDLGRGTAQGLLYSGSSQV